MYTNTFDKQNLGMTPLSFDGTPNNKPFEIPIKDSMDQFSFTLKSRDDVFGNNHSFGDYGFDNVEIKQEHKDNRSPSPMTRRQ